MFKSLIKMINSLAINYNYDVHVSKMIISKTDGL